MDTAPKRVPQADTLQLTEFDGKYDLVMPAELRELDDDQLVALIMDRAGVDESRAREVLATIRKRGWIAMRLGYDRV